MSNIIFDLDGTLTESRSEATPEMLKAIKKLSKKHTVAIISGASKEQMEKQFKFSRKIYKMPQNGNECYLGKRNLWKTPLFDQQCEDIMFHINDIYKHYCAEIPIGDLIENRGSQISFSFVGHHADLAKKKAFDPTGSFRKKVLREFPFKHKTLKIKIGGTTCLDYIHKRGTKADNLKRLLGEDLKGSLYVGDQFYPGGNDEDVLSVCHTAEVNGPQETLKIIENLCCPPKRA